MYPLFMERSTKAGFDSSRTCNELAGEDMASTRLTNFLSFL